MFYGGETSRARIQLPSAHAKYGSEDPEIRRRGEFEMQVLAELSTHFPEDPYYPLLFKSMMDNWSLCLKEHGLPSLEELGQLSEEEQQKLFNEIELSDRQISKLSGLEDKCWERARVHAGKDEETDRLLKQQQQYYLNIANEWVKANPDSAVPLAQ